VARFESEWLAEFPRDLAFRVYLGERALSNADPTGAEKYFEDVLRIAPDNVPAMNNLAWAQHLSNRSSALGTIERALRARPDAPELLDTQATILAAKEQNDAAIKSQQQALLGDPANALYRFRLAEYLLKAGKAGAARAELEKLSALGSRFPKQAEVKAMLAKL
jgi:cellulose synthase operon protein C